MPRTPQRTLIINFKIIPFGAKALVVLVKHASRNGNFSSERHLNSEILLILEAQNYIYYNPKLFNLFARYSRTFWLIWSLMVAASEARAASSASSEDARAARSSLSDSWLRDFLNPLSALCLKSVWKCWLWDVKTRHILIHHASVQCHPELVPDPEQQKSSSSSSSSS